MDENEARKLLADAAMRRGLHEWLWQFHPDARLKHPAPCPFLSDERIQEELQRIFFGKRKKFLGLF